MEVNWKLLVMKFKMGETIMTLKGDPRLHDTGVSLKVIAKTLQQEGQGIWLEQLLVATKDRKIAVGLPLSIVQLLERYGQVFKEPRESSTRTSY